MADTVRQRGEKLIRDKEMHCGYDTAEQERWLQLDIENLADALRPSRKATYDEVEKAVQEIIAEKREEAVQADA